MTINSYLRITEMSLMKNMCVEIGVILECVTEGNFFPQHKTFFAWEKHWVIMFELMFIEEYL